MDFAYGDVTVWISPLMLFGSVCVWGVVRVVRKVIG